MFEVIVFLNIVIVVFPALVSRVVGGINVDDIHFSLMGIVKNRESMKIVSLNKNIIWQLIISLNVLAFYFG